MGCHLQNANDAETLKLWKAVEVATNKYLQAESKVTAKEEKKVFVYIPLGKLYLLKRSLLAVSTVSDHALFLSGKLPHFFVSSN